ncbi:MAG: hypothetical protein ACXADY_07385 [Candidatus Hodarchaeales archaeon]
METSTNRLYEEVCRKYKRKIPKTVIKDKNCDYYPDKDKIKFQWDKKRLSIFLFAFCMLLPIGAIGFLYVTSLLPPALQALIFIIGVLIFGIVYWKTPQKAWGGCDGCE